MHHNHSLHALAKHRVVLGIGCVRSCYLRVFFFLLPVISPSLVKSDKVNSAESLQELLTSDSEGSCMGVGSPRDMQSPVFHDRMEVND